MKKSQSICLIKLLVVVAIVGSLTACSSESYNEYPQQRQSDSQESKPKQSTPAEHPVDEAPMAGTVPVPNAPAPAPAPAGATTKREDCYTIGCWVDPNNAASQHVYGKFDLNKDNCLNKQEAKAWALDQCLTHQRSRPLYFLHCPKNEDGQPIVGAWQVKCSFGRVEASH